MKLIMLYGVFLFSHLAVVLNAPEIRIISIQQDKVIFLLGLVLIVTFILIYLMVSKVQGEKGEKEYLVNGNTVDANWMNSGLLFILFLGSEFWSISIILDYINMKNYIFNFDFFFYLVFKSLVVMIFFFIHYLILRYVLKNAMVR